MTNRALAWSLVAWLLPFAGARAESTIRVSARAGIGGVVRADTWTPLVVEVENGGAPVDAVVVARYAESYGGRDQVREPVGLAAGSRKRLTLPFRVRQGPQEIEIAVEDRRGRPLVSVPLRVDPAGSDTVLVGVVGGRTDPGLRGLVTPTVRVVAVDPEELPDRWPSLEAFDALVLRDPDGAQLGPSRIEALRRWVAAGGILAVTAAERWRSIDAPALLELLPVRLIGVRTIDAALLPAPWGLGSGEVAVAVASSLRGDTHFAMPDDAKPLVAEGRFGLGRVAFLGCDPGSVPGVPSEETAALWSAVLRLPPELPEDPSGAYGYTTSRQLVQQELSRIPPLKPPSVFLVAALIGLYVLVVGPGDYLLLKRLGRPNLTWITYPAAISAFSGLLYLYARVTRSSDMQVRTISVVDVAVVPPTAPSPARVFGGVYSPRAGSYDVEIEGGDWLAGSFREQGLFSSAGGAEAGTRLTIGKRPTLSVPIPVWSMAGVELVGQAVEPTPILAEIENDGAFRVTNASGGAIDYVGLLVGDRLIDGGPLAPGGSVRIRRDGAGVALLEVPAGGQVWGQAARLKDPRRLAQVIAFGTDPPHGDAETPSYQAVRPTRRREGLERPRERRGEPMVIAVTPAGEVPIAVRGEGVAREGVVVWRQGVLK